MHRVTVLDEHAVESECLYEGLDARRASLTYSRAVLRRRAAHLRWVDGISLPGLPDKVVAERMGDPCEKPCCVPLAEPWPEPTAVTSS